MGLAYAPQKNLRSLEGAFILQGTITSVPCKCNGGMKLSNLCTCSVYFIQNMSQNDANLYLDLFTK